MYVILADFLSYLKFPVCQNRNTIANAGLDAHARLSCSLDKHGNSAVELYISRGRLAWWLLAFLHSGCKCKCVVLMSLRLNLCCLMTPGIIKDIWCRKNNVLRSMACRDLVTLQLNTHAHALFYVSK